MRPETKTHIKIKPKIAIPIRSEAVLSGFLKLGVTPLGGLSAGVTANIAGGICERSMVEMCTMDTCDQL